MPPFLIRILRARADRSWDAVYSNVSSLFTGIGMGRLSGRVVSLDAD